MNILFLHNVLTQTCGISRIIFNSVLSSSNKNLVYYLIIGKNNLKEKSALTLFNSYKVVGQIFPFDFIKILFFCKKNKINIIHSFHRKYDLYAFFLSKIINIKTVTSVQSKVKGKKKLSYKSEKLISVSKAITKHLINYFHINENKISLIPNFILPANYKVTKDINLLKTELKLKNQKVIGFVGRIDIKEKGIDILLNSFSLLNKHYELVLVLVGDGNDIEFVKQTIEKKSLNVILINETTEVANYYNLFDLFILPSKIEPFGIVLLEAGLMKLPVIASNIDGIPEIIENNVNGILFESENIDDLAMKIEFLLENADFANELGEHLYKKVIKNYTAEKNIKKINELYLKF